MLYYNLIDNNNKVVLSNIPDGFLDRIRKCESISEVVRYNGLVCRQGKMGDHEIGEVFLLTSDVNEVNSSRMFKDKILLYFNFIQELKEIRNEISGLILENITKINAYCIQCLYELVPEDIAKEKTYEKQIGVLEKHISVNTKSFAKGLFKINRNILNLKAECSSLRYLFSKKIQIDKASHNIYNAIKPSLHVYMPHLKKKGVNVEIDDRSSKDINLNFEYFESAMIPFLDNIVKYILPESVLYIYFADTLDGYAINFDMTSMAIKKEELTKILDKGYSGINAVKNQISGNGLGMSRIVDSLFINNAELKININVNKKTEKRFRNTVYERNVFQIIFLSQ